MLGLEADLPACRASDCCTLLVWSPASLRSALRAANASELEALAEALRSDAPGCADVDVARLRSWLDD
jgi:hypothetical protein